MTASAAYVAFGQTRLVPITLYVNAHPVPYTGQPWAATLFVERGEDWYAFESPQYRNKVIRVVTRKAWLLAGHGLQGPTHA